MTTIAFDGQTIAADGLRTWGDQIAGRAHKKLHLEGRCIYAFTGYAPMFGVMIKWHQNGADPANLPPQGGPDDDGWCLIVLDSQGIGQFTRKCPYIERFDPPIAFGAGQDYAHGAMWAGKTAEEAVRLVAQHTNHTGGEVQVIHAAAVMDNLPGVTRVPLRAVP